MDLNKYQLRDAHACPAQRQNVKIARWRDLSRRSLERDRTRINDPDTCPWLLIL